jgi:dolichyl-phosphate beta-glucosyltransferase
MRIVEVPINWYYAERSQVRPIHDTYNMLREVLKVRLNSWRGRYQAENPITNQPVNKPANQQTPRIGEL